MDYVKILQLKEMITAQMTKETYDKVYKLIQDELREQFLKEDVNIIKERGITFIYPKCEHVGFDNELLLKEGKEYQVIKDCHHGFWLMAETNEERTFTYQDFDIRFNYK